MIIDPFTTIWEMRWARLLFFLTDRVGQDVLNFIRMICKEKDPAAICRSLKGPKAVRRFMKSKLSTETVRVGKGGLFLFF